MIFISVSFYIIRRIGVNDESNPSPSNDVFVCNYTAHGKHIQKTIWNDADFIHVLSLRAGLI